MKLLFIVFLIGFMVGGALFSVVIGWSQITERIRASKKESKNKTKKKGER